MLADEKRIEMDRNEQIQSNAWLLNDIAEALANAIRINPFSSNVDKYMIQIIELRQRMTESAKGAK